MLSKDLQRLSLTARSQDLQPRCAELKLNHCYWLLLELKVFSFYHVKASFASWLLMMLMAGQPAKAGAWKRGTLVCFGRSATFSGWLLIGWANYHSLKHPERHGYFALTSHCAEEHYVKTPRKGQQRLVQVFFFYSERTLLNNSFLALCKRWMHPLLFFPPEKNIMREE